MKNKKQFVVSTIACSVALTFFSASSFAAGPPASGWSSPVKVANINVDGKNDGCEFISQDGKSMYVASNRSKSGGFGSMDLYVFHRNKTSDEFDSIGTNLGGSINTSHREICPTLSDDGHFLFFASDRPVNPSDGKDSCGSRDIYVSYRSDTSRDDVWESARNLGCIGQDPNGVNSIGTDHGPNFFRDESDQAYIYFSSNFAYSNAHEGGHDIWYFKIDQAAQVISEVMHEDDLSSNKNDHRPAILANGLEALIDSNRDSTDDNVYIATRKSQDKPFGTPTAVSEINTTTHERRAVFNIDGSELYFSRWESDGSFNVWVSTRPVDDEQ